MAKIGEYDHLNNDKETLIEIDMKKLVETVEKLNYGTHRFLSELVRQLEKEPAKQRHTPELAAGLRRLLEAGYH